MSQRSRRGNRRTRAEDYEEHIDERWLLTYADMITLLMALFIVLFSISSVNKSKYEVLQRALSDAFSGKVLPGGPSIKNAGGSPQSDTQGAAPAYTAEVVPTKPQQEQVDAVRQAAAREEAGLERLQRRINQEARRLGLSSRVRATVGESGLQVRLLTDDILFASGSATPRPEGRKLMQAVARVLRVDRTHRVIVEGHTDDEPIRSAVFPSNWELSGARASSIVVVLIENGLRPDRLVAQGRSHTDPIASNSKASGRAQNRRVEILLPRQISWTPSDQPDGGATDQIALPSTSIVPPKPSIRP